MSTMPSDRAQALYYDSAAALRLVDVQLDELREGDLVPAVEPGSRRADAPGADLSPLLAHTNDELHAVLARLQDGRLALTAPAVEPRTAPTHRLREVTGATEVATIDIMDACDRAAAKLDALDAIADDATDHRVAAAALRAELRDELFGMIGALQFQDLTTQMLRHATAVLTDVEGRLQALSRTVEGAIAETPAPRPSGEWAFDPEVTLGDAGRRQAVADAVFTAPAGRAPRG